MRARLAALIWDTKELSDLASAVHRELGLRVPYVGVGVYDWPTFLSKASLIDVLDLITVAYMHLESEWRARRGREGTWLIERAQTRLVEEVERIFREENVHYRVDERGGVHFTFDREFDQNWSATIAALQGPRYKNALDSFNAASSDLNKVPPDGKDAIREVFAALEGLFRLMFPDAPRLTAKDCNRLSPLVHKIYAGDAAALGAAAKALRSFSEWVEAAGMFGPNSELCTRPPCRTIWRILHSAAGT